MLIGSNRKLIFVATEDWYFHSHRLPLVSAARAAGFEVVVATRVGRSMDAIRAAGARVIPLKMFRRSANPFRELQVILQLIGIYKKERPDLVHHIALKPVLYGSVAAAVTKIPAVVNAIAGTGFVMASRTWKAKFMRPFVRRAWKVALSHGRSWVILQNPDDLEMFCENILADCTRARLIRGVGVDLERFSTSAEPEGVPLVVLPARLLWDKGVGEFAQAARLLRSQGVRARFALVGASDLQNPAAVPQSALDDWQAAGLLECWGWREDMPAVYRQCHVVCLPSYREGFPKSLAEAAACGRAIVTTDTPGCREVVCHGNNGLLVPVRDAELLAFALEKLIRDVSLRETMGRRGRRRAETEFSISHFTAKTLALYREILAEPHMSLTMDQAV